MGLELIKARVAPAEINIDGIGRAMDLSALGKVAADIEFVPATITDPITQAIRTVALPCAYIVDMPDALIDKIAKRMCEHLIARDGE